MRKQALQRVILAVLVGVTSASSISKRQTNGPIVDLGYAQYQGVFDASNNLTNFFGVRYAAAPTGNNRWRAPQAPQDTAGVQLANTEPPGCIDASTNGVSPTNPDSKSFKRQSSGTSEDCLFVNVAFPGSKVPSKNLPTVVWIHGGGYILGSASQFQLQDLIRESNNGVVAVAIQYRLGVFGFLSGKKVKEDGVLNAGLLDQHFALRWVQKHIAKFGGDPNRVTIWGLSAGAGSVLQHVVAEDGKTTPPLFRGAITSSTFLPSQYAFDDRIPERLYNDVVSQTNCSGSADTLMCLRAAEVPTLEVVNNNINGAAFFGTFPFAPVIDGTFIKQRVTEALRQGKVNGQALLSIGNTDEGSLFVNQTAPANTTRYAGNLFPNFEAKQDITVARLYNGLGSPKNQENLIMGESIFVCPTYYLLNAFRNRSFKGQFAVPPATHGLDQDFYFPTGRSTDFNNTDFQKAFSQSFMSFVISLDPNVKLDPSNITPKWRMYSGGRTEVVFNRTGDAADVHSITTDSGLLERCRFWESVSGLTGQ